MKKIILSLISILVVIVGFLIFLYIRNNRPIGILWDLNDAARNGDVARMEHLISKGANPVIVPSFADGAVKGFTPLFEAVIAGHPDAVAFLISKGADVNRSEATETPLDIALNRKAQFEKIIEILQEAGAYTTDKLSAPKK